GNPLPPPVVDPELEGGEGGRVAAGGDPLGLLVAFVLTPQGVGGDGLGSHRPDGLQHLDLFVADLVGPVPHRGLHGGDHQKLQQVILEHVANDAGRVVVAGAAADVDLLGHGDLHVVDVVAVP